MLALHENFFTKSDIKIHFQFFQQMMRITGAEYKYKYRRIDKFFK